MDTPSEIVGSGNPVLRSPFYLRHYQHGTHVQIRLHTHSRHHRYGPLLLACTLVVFLAGPDDCQNLYMAAKKAPHHRALDFVERRQDDVFNYQDHLQLSYKYHPPSPPPSASPLSAQSHPPTVWRECKTNRAELTSRLIGLADHLTLC